MTHARPSTAAGASVPACWNCMPPRRWDPWSSGVLRHRGRAAGRRRTCRSSTAPCAPWSGAGTPPHTGPAAPAACGAGIATATAWNTSLWRPESVCSSQPRWPGSNSWTATPLRTSMLRRQRPHQRVHAGLADPPVLDRLVPATVVFHESRTPDVECARPDCDLRVTREGDGSAPSRTAHHDRTRGRRHVVSPGGRPLRASARRPSPWHRHAPVPGRRTGPRCRRR